MRESGDTKEIMFRKLLCSLAFLTTALLSQAYDAKVDDIYYNFDSDTQTAEVTYKYSDSDNKYAYVGTVEIPQTVTYNGTTYSVTSIGEYTFNYCSDLTEITIPSSITSIGDNAFSICTSLSKVNITDLAAWCNITFDGYDANPLCYARNLYLNDTLITDLTIPESVTSIGNYTFYKCSSLTSVTIGNSVTTIGDWAFLGCRGLTSITISNSVTSIGNYAFYTCSGLTSITIPNSVTSIGNKVFYGCTSLAELTIENGAETLSLGYNDYSTSYIGEGLFYDCPLKTLYLGRNLSYETSKYYGYSPFYNCTKLTSVTIGNSVSQIGNYAFDSCTSLADLTIEDGTETLSLGYNYYYSSSTTGQGLFYDCPLETLYLGRNLSYETSYNYGYSPFWQCKTLTSVTIGNFVTSIEERAFYRCSGLTSVKISNSVTTIGNNAFNGCSGLTEITIPNSVTSIENHTFCNCSGLTSITLSNSMTSIEKYTFYGCTGLTSIEIPAGVTTIGENAFNGCSMTSVTCAATTPPTATESTFDSETLENATLYVPKTSTSLYEAADVWKEFSNTIVGIEVTGIEEMNSVIGNTEVRIYDLQGKRVTTPGHGVYIISTGDIVKKVIL